MERIEFSDTAQSGFVLPANGLAVENMLATRNLDRPCDAAGDRLAVD